MFLSIFCKSEYGEIFSFSFINLDILFLKSIISLYSSESSKLLDIRPAKNSLNHLFNPSLYFLSSGLSIAIPL